MCIRDRYNAQEALDMGLVNKVVPLEQLEDEYVQWAEEMMLLSPLALRMIKAGLLSLIHISMGNPPVCIRMALW